MWAIRLVELNERLAQLNERLAEPNERLVHDRTPLAFGQQIFCFLYARLTFSDISEGPQTY